MQVYRVNVTHTNSEYCFLVQLVFWGKVTDICWSGKYLQIGWGGGGGAHTEIVRVGESDRIVG